MSKQILLTHMSAKFSLCFRIFNTISTDGDKFSSIQINTIISCFALYESHTLRHRI